jgi:hypothetical protein
MGRSNVFNEQSYTYVTVHTTVNCIIYTRTLYLVE